MIRTLSTIVWSLVASCSFLHADTPYPNIAPTDPKTPAEELKSFKVPPGFEVQLVASDPDIRKPIQMAFDAKGRLWVTTSEEYPFPAEGRPGKDRLYVLEDFGPDGKAKKVSIFADDLNIPIGVLPLPDCKSVIVSSIDPGKKKGDATCWIWKLTDIDGDGKYDEKEKLYGPFGCRDTHGMNNSYTLMPDGWVYACHGYLNDSKVKGKDGHEIEMNSGNTFRFRPDGSRIEIWTRGQVNPFGIAVDPYFNLYTADCHSKPITQLIRGATYQSFSKPDDGLGFAPHVTIHGHDSTALCGLVYYAANHFPKECLDCMFLGNVTSNCINWDKIEFKGSTPVAIDKGMFLSSKDLWFRPTDIKLGPDGALYFADFYNKIIGHYEVELTHPQRDKLRGRVWRIVWKGLDGKGAATKIPQDFSVATPRELFDDLGSSNLTVRLQIINQMIHRGEGIMEDFKPIPANRNEANRLKYFLWVLNSFKKKRAEFPPEFIFSGLDKDENTLLAVHTLLNDSNREDWSENDIKLAILGTDFKNPRARRAAVEALTAHPSAAALHPLIRALSKTNISDDHLRYAIRVAFRESLRQLDDWDKAAGKSEWTPAEIKALADIALAVPNQSAATFIKRHLQDLAKHPGSLPAYIEHAVRYGPNKDFTKDLIAFALHYKAEDLELSVLLFQACQRGVQKRGGDLKTDMTAVEGAGILVVRAVESSSPIAIQGAIDIATSLKLPIAFEPLQNVAGSKHYLEAHRAAALTGLAAIDAKKALPILAKYLNEANQPIGLRERAATTIASTNLVEGQDELVKSLQSAPARLQTVIALAMAGNSGALEKLLKAIEEGKASARLLLDKAVQTKLMESRLPKVGERVAALTKGLPSADQRLLQIMKSRGDGFAKAKPDAVLGKAVFTKNCAICHQIGNEGVKIGPQLDGIGGRGLDRLLEDIIDPNRNVDAAFRTSTLMLKDGKSLSGLVLREEGQIVVMADDRGKEIRVAKDDIEERRSSPLSPMPANVAEIITEKDFYDLLAYLLTQRAKPK